MTDTEEQAPTLEELDTEDTDTEDTENSEDTDDTEDDESRSFSADYVATLREEAGKHRRRAADAEKARDQLARRLFTAQVAATGRLADPADLPFDADALEDGDRLTEQIDRLLEERPHLKSRRVSGDVGQHRRSNGADVSLVGLLRRGT